MQTLQARLERLERSQGEGEPFFLVFFEPDDPGAGYWLKGGGGSRHFETEEQALAAAGRATVCFMPRNGRERL